MIIRAPSQTTTMPSAEQQRVARPWNSSSSRWVASWRFIVSTSRFSQCARRSRWPLKSLIVLMPRSVSRKWLSRRAAQMIASAEACAQRRVGGPAQQAVERRADRDRVASIGAEHGTSPRGSPRTSARRGSPDDEVGGQRLQDRLLRLEARHHVADVPASRSSSPAAAAGARRGWCAPAPSARRRASSASSRAARADRGLTAPAAAEGHRQRRSRPRSAETMRLVDAPEEERATAARRPRSRGRAAAGARAPAAGR